MSPWTALLQSLHSALIDEVTDRHPEPKPELGLPKKQSAFQFPSDAATKMIWVKTSFGPLNGAVLIAYQDEFMKALNVNAGQFLGLISKRAGSEFTRRQIAPAFQTPAELKNSDKIPAELSALPRIVWIPITLPAGSCWFGIAA
jgi:hypothetical protein